MNDEEKQRIIVAITGASGAVYGIELLKALSKAQIETHLIVSDSAKMTLASETGLSFEELCGLASAVHNAKNIGASIASGSFKTLGMIVAPCSVKTLSEIAYGISSSLIIRAADVVLKERRRLVLMVRETPLHLGHLRAMTQVTEAGAIVMPPVPAFYHQPKTINDIVTHTIARALDLFDLPNSTAYRWSGLGQKP